MATCIPLMPHVFELLLLLARLFNVSHPHRHHPRNIDIERRSSLVAAALDQAGRQQNCPKTPTGHQKRVKDIANDASGEKIAPWSLEWTTNTAAGQQCRRTSTKLACHCRVPGYADVTSAACWGAAPSPVCGTQNRAWARLALLPTTWKQHAHTYMQNARSRTFICLSDLGISL
ncbi:hypothetical protein NA57DRAFT_59297 [Rhizodiscina lignyota]|uniref:Secreted protein n=1 Tax=Rhizodiscina lignyota TaxID=1504668 RepID=A0A9P4IDI3_9PEZI|nr:hypothetical protein NA57DRAFT_59297 [Rhizodiscina lignyota]